jgi:hypothetical protein
MTDTFNVLEGIQSITLVVVMTYLLRSPITFMMSVNKNLVVKRKGKNTRLFVFVMKILRTFMFLMFVITTLITVLAVLGMYISNVSVNTAHIFALVIPMWLMIREKIILLITAVDK